MFTVFLFELFYFVAAGKNQWPTLSLNKICIEIHWVVYLDLCASHSWQCILCNDYFIFFFAFFRCLCWFTGLHLKKKTKEGKQPIWRVCGLLLPLFSLKPRYRCCCCLFFITIKLHVQCILQMREETKKCNAVQYREKKKTNRAKPTKYANTEAFMPGMQNMFSPTIKSRTSHQCKVLWVVFVYSLFHWTCFEVNLHCWIEAFCSMWCDIFTTSNGGARTATTTTTRTRINENYTQTPYWSVHVLQWLLQWIPSNKINFECKQNPFRVNGWLFSEWMGVFNIDWNEIYLTNISKVGSVFKPELVNKFATIWKSRHNQIKIAKISRNIGITG